MNKTFKPVLTILAGFIALFGISTPADAASGSRPAVRSVCETGYRGMPAYDAKCLRTGNVLDGVNLWFREDGKSNGRVLSSAERRMACKNANQARTTRAGIIDGLNDVAYDRYRNHRFVLSVAGTVGVMDCQYLGVKIKK